MSGTTPTRAWLLASRPHTLPAAAVPVVVGAGAVGVAFRAWHRVVTGRWLIVAGASLAVGAALAVVLFWSVPDFIDTDLGCQVG